MDNFSDIVIDQTIEDVSQSTWQYAMTHYRSQIINGGILVVVTAIGIIWLAISSKNIGYTRLLFLDIFVPLYLYNRLLKKFEHAFMQQFAKLNNFDYDQSGNLENKSGYLFTLGHDHTVEDDITGSIQNCPVELFNYSYTEGSGKSQHTYHKTIFIINFQTPVPHITLKYKGDIELFQKLGDKLKLEGDFNEKFDLFVQKGFELEALQIFAPDFMAQVETWKFEMEFSQTSLNIYADHEIDKRIDLQNMFNAAKSMASKLDPLVVKMKSDITSVMDTQK